MAANDHSLMSTAQPPTPPPDDALTRVEARLARLETRFVRYLLALGFTPDGDPPPKPDPRQLELFPKDE